MKYIDVLKRCDIFKNVSEENILEIIKAADVKIKKFSPKQIVCKKNVICRDICIVLDGSAWGGEAVFERGDFFAVEEAAAEGSLMYDLYSAEESEVLFINFKKLLKCSCMGYPFFYRILDNIFGIISERNMLYSQRLSVLSQNTLRNKLLEFLRLQKQIHGDSSFSLNMTRSELGEYLCVDRCSLSRELTKLRNEGVMDINKQQIILKHRQI